MSFTFNFTKDQVRKMIPDNQYIDDWYVALSTILPEYEINTPERVSAFIAQCAHESANFKILKENLNYRANSLIKTFKAHFPSIAIAKQYELNPEKIANKVYANRMGNDDEASGDGFRYYGRGLIQLTGKDNYTLFAESIETPLSEIPAYLQTFEGAVQSACWFWEQNNLNALADSRDIIALSKRINGGTNGLEHRIELYKKAKQLFGVT